MREPSQQPQTPPTAPIMTNTGRGVPLIIVEMIERTNDPKIVQAAIQGQYPS